MVQTETSPPVRAMDNLPTSCTFIKKHNTKFLHLKEATTIGKRNKYPRQKILRVAAEKKIQG